jgi:hypothetical protein
LYFVVPPITTGIQPPNLLQVQQGPLVSVGEVILVFRGAGQHPQIRGHEV